LTSRLLSVVGTFAGIAEYNCDDAIQAQLIEVIVNTRTVGPLTVCSLAMSS
jgi:hypothetical protein